MFVFVWTNTGRYVIINLSFTSWFVRSSLLLSYSLKVTIDGKDYKMEIVIMDHFELVSQYTPTGDQPQAIEELVKGFKEGNQFQTFLGVTGSGKAFTMTNVIRN